MKPKGSRIDASIFGNLNTLETLDYYDGPLIFTTYHRGKTFYCHMYDDESTEKGYSTCYFCREVSKKELAELKGKKIDFHTFLSNAKPLYMVRGGAMNQKHFIDAYVIDIEEYKKDFPKKGVFL